MKKMSIFDETIPEAVRQLLRREQQGESVHAGIIGSGSKDVVSMAAKLVQMGDKNKLWIVHGQWDCLDPLGENEVYIGTIYSYGSHGFYPDSPSITGFFQCEHTKKWIGVKNGAAHYQGVESWMDSWVDVLPTLG